MYANFVNDFWSSKFKTNLKALNKDFLPEIITASLYFQPASLYFQIGTLNPNGSNERFSFNEFIQLFFTLPGTNQ